MKILITNYDSVGNHQYNGGGAIVIQRVAKYLSKNNDVTVLSGRYPGSKELDIIDGVTYIRLGNEFLPGQLNQLLYSLILPLTIKKFDVDVVIESFTPPISTGLLPIFTSRPVIGFALSLFGDDISKKYLNIPFGFFENKGLHLYKNVIVTSKEMAKKIRRKSPKTKPHILPLGVEKPKLPLKVKSSSDKYLLCIGRIDIRQKGLDTLLGAYELLKPEERTPLWIVGTGLDSEVKQLKKMITDKKLEKSVVLKGFVKGQQKIEMIAGAEAMIVPSRYETFSISSLEALAYGTKLITSDLPELEWIPRDFRDVFMTCSARSLSEKILHLKKRSVATTKKISTFVEPLFWENILPRYEQLIREIVGVRI